MRRRRHKTIDVETTLVVPGAAPAPGPAPAPTVNGGPPAPGGQLDQYLIEREIGAGGMGVVYQARDRLLDRPVALKVLPPSLCTHPEYLRRLAREAQIQANIDSPYVVTVHALMEREGALVLVMEYLQGETLEQRLRRAGPLSVAEAVDVFEQACVGIEHIHGVGIIHQDLKPTNLFITSSGRVKLMDFGVARRLDDSRIVDCGSMMGTLLYMSPEQIKGREVDFRADVYTLGITLFEALTGHLPFERRTHYALMHAHVQENPPPPSRYQREIPRGLEKVILKAIAKEPNRRYQTITEFRHALHRYRSRWRRTPAAGRARSVAMRVERRLYPRHALAVQGAPPGIRRLLLGSLSLDVLLLTGIIGVLAFAALSAPAP